MPNLLEDINQKVFFQASEIEAFFPDGSITYSSEDVQVESHANGRDVLSLQKGNDTKHVVRLYMIPPEQDWRANANFTWSLSMGWMRVPSVDEDSEDTDDWLYWNKENNVHSQIQAFSGSELFSTDSVTLHFEAMNRFPWSQKHDLSPKLPNTKIVMKDVLLGAHLEESEPTARHRPCQSTVCDIVDGVVGSETMFGVPIPSIFSEGAHGYLLVLAVGVPALVVLMCVIRFLQKRWVIREYDPIEGEDQQDSTGDQKGEDKTVDEE